MTKPSYSELLRDPRWQRRRLEIMNRDKFACARCGFDDKTLHVHHRHYTKGHMPWEYADHELVTLCEGCHEQTHQEAAALKELIAKLPMDGPRGVDEATHLLAGFAHITCGHDLYSHFNDGPHEFTLGRIAALISWCDVQTIWELGDALAPLSDGQRGVALRRLAADIKANPPEEPSPRERFDPGAADGKEAL